MKASSIKQKGSKFSFVKRGRLNVQEEEEEIRKTHKHIFSWLTPRTKETEMLEMQVDVEEM